MLGGIVAVLIVVWFYRSAEARGAPAVSWAIAGLIVYYVPNFIWSLMVAKPWLAGLHAQNSTLLATIVGHSSVLLGAAVAAAVRQFALMKTPVR
jgi:hypothetical protein